MKSKNSLLVMALLGFLPEFCVGLDAAVFNYTNLATFNSVVGPHPTIGFADLPVGTIVTNQYSRLGVTFTDGDDTTVMLDSSDGFGLAGSGIYGQQSIITLSFAASINAVGAEFPGALRIDVFSGTTEVGTSANFGFSGHPFFGGVVSDTSFDRVVLSDWVDNTVYIDNLHFGSVPEPGSSVLMLIGGGYCWIYRRRKRRAAYQARWSGRRRTLCL
jgi:hypothetical protein